MIKLLGVFLLLIIPFEHALAASFDCAKASTNIEHLICNSDELSELDSSYGQLYKQSLKEFPQQRSKIANDAFLALQQRNGKCSDEACLRDWYKTNIAAVVGTLTTPFADLTERQSVGIFQMDYLTNTSIEVEKGETDNGFKTSTYRTALPIYDAVGGNAVGTMKMTLSYLDIADGSHGTVKLLDNEGREIVPTKVGIQYRYNPILYVFDVRGDWFNVSSSSIKPLWINKYSLEPNFLKHYITREQSVLDASDITFLSTHNLRSNPSTQSKILTVLGKDRRERTEPLQLNGDWMKVSYKVPAPGSNVWEEGEGGIGADVFIEHTGWIKWRRKPQDEYDHVRFEHY